MSNSLFESDWWLDAVAPGRWRRLEVRTNDRIVATLPLVHKRRFGLDAFTTPLFTKFLGPWLAPPDPGTKYSSEIARQKRLLTELIDQIPPSAYFAQNLHPSLTNWQPFFWRGFSATVRYTYVLDGIADDDSAIDGFRENVRRAIRKAEESLTVAGALVELRRVLRQPTISATSCGSRSRRSPASAARSPTLRTPWSDSFARFGSGMPDG